MLLDKLSRPLHDLRISVIDRCNFRCRYCMPEEEYSKHYKFLEETQWLTFAEIERLSKIFIGLGVNKIRLTGGEPLLRPQLHVLIEKLSRITELNDLSLTTNGILLAEHAASLRAAGLKRLTVSLDTLDEKIFKTMSGGRGSVKDVLNGIEAAQRAGFQSIKINVVVQRGINDHTILDLVGRFRATGHVLRFIEYMDVGNCNHWQLGNVVPSAELLKMIHAVYPVRALKPNYRGEVAERYEFSDGEGEIGFISSVTQPFCGDCSRARLSTDGKIFTCLFAETGKNLRGPLRNGATDTELTAVITTIWQARNDRYSELRSQLTGHATSKVEMFQIGG